MVNESSLSSKQSKSTVLSKLNKTKVHPLYVKLDSTELFIQNVTVRDYVKDLADSMLKKKHFYFKEQLGEIVNGGDSFPLSLQDLTICRNFDMTINVYWKCNERDQIKAKFHTIIRQIF